MSANLLLALLGGIIVAGFLANLIFKYTKVPSVVKLMGIGLLLGPVLGIVDGEELRAITPFFGKVALLIILFAGGLKLNIETVISQLGKAVYLALLAFLATFALSFSASLYIIDLGVMQSVILATLVSGTASAIVIPVVNKLSVSENTKSLLSIESALSNLLILVVVIIACDFYVPEDAGGVVEKSSYLVPVLDFLLKIFVSLGMAIIFGMLWSRVMGFMRGESLSYMLTLGFIFLLNYLVDELKGNGAISILFFAIVLANMSRITARFGPKLKSVLGVKIDSTKYALDEFLKGISEELSFLVTTFFFVLLGTLVSFKTLTVQMGINIGIITAAMVLGRLVVLPLFLRLKSQRKIIPAERIVLFSMMPRGLATAVMAFLPYEQYAIPGTKNFPTYAMFAILMSNVIMTIFVAIGEGSLKRAGRTQAKGAAKSPELESKLAKKQEKPSETVSEPKDVIVADEKPVNETVAEEVSETPTPFKSLLKQWLGINKESFIRLDKGAIKSIDLGDLVFWMRVITTISVAALGVLMDRSEVILVAMLFSPIAPLINTLAVSLLTGDIYMFLKGNLKVIILLLAGVVLAGLIALVTPFTGVPDEILNRIQPTILDFLLAFVGGLITPIVLLRGRRLENLAITPIISLIFFPPMVTIGYALGTGWNHQHFGQILIGGALSLSAGFTAMLIGMIITQWVLGFTTHQASDFIQKWKEREIEHGALHKWFERMRLVKFLEYVGNPFARIFVLAIMAIALVVPLQITFNNAVKDYSYKTTVEKYALQLFEIEGRSQVISTNYEAKEKQVNVLINVSTNDNFSQDEKKSFEEKVESELGVPIKLRLSESFNSLGTLPLTSAPSTSIASVDEQLLLVSSRIQTAMADLPPLENTRFLGFGIESGLRTGVFVIRLDYLADEPMSTNTALLVKRQLADRLGIKAKSVRLNHFPTLYFSDSPELEQFRDSSGMIPATSTFERGAGIGMTASISFPSFVPKDSSQKLMIRYQRQKLAFGDSLAIRYDSTKTDRFKLSLE